MKTDWIAKHFFAIKECGEDINIVYAHIAGDIIEERPHWYELAHSDYHGISDLAWLLRQKHFQGSSATSA